MKNYFKNISLLLIVFLGSCCSWNDSSKNSYLTECKSRLTEEFCECSLEKLMTKFNCYEDAIENEGEFAEIFIECH